MAVDQTAIPKDLRALNLNRTVLPTSASNNPLPPNPSDLLLLLNNSNSPRSRPQYHPAPTTTTAATIDPLLAFHDPLANWAPAIYPNHQFLPNGAEQMHADDFPAAAADPPSLTKRVKFLCSFGGRILPRPSDGALRYVGGHTRIVALRRDASFPELMQKMADVYGNTAVIKYQLPDEDLDALVSVSCPEDLENMMEEYDKLAESSPEGSAKLRVFLFSPADLDAPGSSQAPDLHDTGQRYMDAVNGISSEPGVLGMRRKESAASMSSTQNSDGVVGEIADNVAEGFLSAFTSPTVSQDASRSVYVEKSNPVLVDVQRSVCIPPPPPQTLPSTRLEQSPPTHAAAAYSSQTYMDPLQEGFNRVDYIHHPGQIQYVNPQQLGYAGAPVGLTAFPQQSYMSGVHINTAMPAPQIGSMKPIQSHTKVEPYLEDNSYACKVSQLPPTDSSYKPLQPLSQLPPLPPSALQGQNVDRFGWSQVPPPLASLGQMLKLDDCLMCQKALPHAHSDTFTKEHGASGSAASVPEISPLFQSLHSEDVMKSRIPHRVVTGVLPDGMVEHQVEGTFVAPHLGAYRYSLVPEPLKHGVDKVDLQKIENFDQTRVLHPQPANLVSTPHVSYEMYLSSLSQAPAEDALQQQSPPLAAHQYLLKQDAVTRNLVGVSVSAGRSGVPQNLEPPIRDHVAEFSYDQLNPIEGMIETLRLSPSDTSAVTEQLKPALRPQLGDSGHVEGGKMEVLRISPQTTGMREQWKAVSKPNISASKPEGSQLVKETGDNVKPEEKEKELPMGNAFIIPGGMPEMSYFKPADQLPSSTLDVTRPQNLQPADSIQVSQAVGNVGSYPHHFELGIEPPINLEQLPGVSSTTLKNPSGDWNDETSRFYPVSAFNGISASPSSNVPFPLSNVSSTTWQSGYIQGPVASESLFSNLEPWQIIQNTHLPPPMPRRVASRETLIPRDSCIENCSKDGGESRIAARIEEGSSHQPSDPLRKDTHPDSIQSTRDSAEKLVKQELQSVAEGVASSVLQPPILPLSGVYAHETRESVHELSKDRGVGEDNVYSQGAVSPEDKIFQDIKSAQLGKTNIGLQVTEDIGHLQIIKNSDLEELRELGSGTFGTVYHGKWRGSDVAIKRINDRCFSGKQSEQERMRADFWNEASKLADLHHPNVVAFYGVVLDGPGGSIATVTEYMVNGSLRNVLQKNDKTLDRRKRLLIAMDVAFGMEYLHGKNIVHFDLKSDNLLVNLRDPQRPICKVGDLGLSKVKCQTLISGGVRGTLPWMAPELLNGSSNLVSEKVDVFSFGIVMWELLTGEEPYADLHYGAIIGGIVSNTLRPPVPESCDPEWRSLMEKCWSSEPSERPSFTEIAGKLRVMAASVPNRGQT